MNPILLALLSAVAISVLVSTTYILYAGVMHLKHLRDEGKLSQNQIILASVGLVIAYLADFLTNLVLTPIFFKSLPRHWLFTATLKHYKNNGNQQQQTRAEFWCGLLNSIDPDSRGHC